MPKTVKHNRLAIVRVSSRALLEDWLNLQDAKELLRRHPEILIELRKYEKEQDRLLSYIGNVRIALQSAWEAKDLRGRDWYLSEARRLYRKAEQIGDIGTI